MTNSEALLELKESGMYGNQVHQETIELAISALEENSKLKAEIERLKNGCNQLEIRLTKKTEIEMQLRGIIERLKAELEQSVRLPCKVGDKLFSTENGYIEEFKVRSISHIVNLVEFSRFDETVFFTREEAEQSLKGQV